VEKNDIEINKCYIHSWVQTALAARDLDKTEPADAASDHDTHWNYRTPSPAAETITAIKD
jgi:hypothetical protein